MLGLTTLPLTPLQLLLYVFLDESYHIKMSHYRPCIVVAPKSKKYILCTENIILGKELCFISPARVLPADIPLVVRAEGVGADRGEPQAAGLQQGGRLCTEHWSRDLTHLGGHGLRGLPVAPLHQLLDGELPGGHDQVSPQDVDWLQGRGR